MNISQYGIDFIKKWEGGPLLQATRFGSEKYLTIGYGHYGPDVRIGMKITKQQAEDLLKKDISGSVSKVNALNDNYKYGFLQCEFDALVSFCYNIGNVMQVSANGTRTKDQIAEAMLLYVKSGGKVIPGLVNRRKAEHDLFKSYEPEEETFMQKMEVLKKGSSGSEVYLLQAFLKCKGYKDGDNKVLSLDSNMGDKTVAALKRFQKASGLKVDGMAGPATWDKIING